MPARAERLRPVRQVYRSRPTAAEAGYSDAAWRRTRAAQLEREPWCELCADSGARTLANTVDHRRARRLFPLELQRSTKPGGADHEDNLRSLCGSNRRPGVGGCHNRVASDKARGPHAA